MELGLASFAIAGRGEAPVVRNQGHWLLVLPHVAQDRLPNERVSEASALIIKGPTLSQISREQFVDSKLWEFEYTGAEFLEPL